MLAATLRRATTQGRRLMSDGLTAEGKIKSLPMVYIKGEEMTRYAAQLMLELLRLPASGPSGIQPGMTAEQTAELL